MIILPSEIEIRRFIFQKIRPELVLLLAHPGEGQTDSQMDTGRKKLSDIQFPADGGKSEDIVVLVHHLVHQKFLVIFSDEIEPAFINEQVALEGRLLVVGRNTGLEAGVRRFDIAVAMVDTDDYGLAVGVRVKIHSGSFLPLCGCKMIFGRKKAAHRIDFCKPPISVIYAVFCSLPSSGRSAFCFLSAAFRSPCLLICAL